MSGRPPGSVPHTRKRLSCDRCGVETSVEVRKPGRAIGCRDCRQTDPDYFRAVSSGVRAA